MRPDGGGGPGRSGRRAALAAGIVAAALALVAGHWADARADASQQTRGSALFQGRAPLAGRLGGHAVALPAIASRCANCHQAPATAGAAARPFGGELHGTALATPRPRRGGPPSAYDAGALCRLLRTGVDPAGIKVPAAMPLYDISPADCYAFWAYLRQAP